MIYSLYYMLLHDVLEFAPTNCTTVSLALDLVLYNWITFDSANRSEIHSLWEMILTLQEWRIFENLQ